MALIMFRNFVPEPVWLGIVGCDKRVTSTFGQVYSLLKSSGGRWLMEVPSGPEFAGTFWL